MAETHVVPQWVRTDRWADIASSIEHMTGSLQLVRQRPEEWKWAIIACHSALQGALVCALAGPDGLGCLDNRNRHKMSQWLEANPPPEPYLADFMELMERAYQPDAMSNSGGGPLQRNDAVHNDVKCLNELRRQFVHFSLDGWSIETSALPRILDTGSRLTWLLIFGHPACSHALDAEQLSIFTERLQSASTILRDLGEEGFPPLVPRQLHLTRGAH